MPISELKTESLSTTTLATSGALSVASLASAGAVSGASVSATGVVSGASVSATGAVSGASVSATGVVSGASVSATGVVSGASVSATGAVSGASVAATGAITAASAAISGNLTVSGSTPFRKVRAVCTANVASLASFSVGVNTDGVTLVENDIVLLARQTVPMQNGPYVVGAVVAGVAPLTRPAWFAAGSTVKSGFVLEVGGEGSTYKNTTWKSMIAADSFVVGTNVVFGTDGEFFPQFMSGVGALSSGLLTISTVPIRTNTAAIFITRVGAGTGATNTIEYVIESVTAGALGVASFGVRSALAAGTVNTSDTSTIRWTVINQH